MGRRLRAAAFCATTSALMGCNVVDNFEPRVYSADLQSQNVLNQETLLNIVRASEFQPLTFVQISQFAGTQTETLNAGLPTVTFGPSKTGAQRQWVFGGNALDSSIQGSFQGNPLVSSAFQQGMMSPISPKVLAFLIATYGREPVYYATIDSIVLTTPTDTYAFRNDPSDNNNPAGGSCEIHKGDSFTQVVGDPTVCNFSKFVNFLRTGLDYGVSFELVDTGSGSGGASVTTAAPVAATPHKGAAAVAVPPAVTPAAPPAAAAPSNSTAQNTNATSSPNVSGHLCFDPALAISQYRQELTKDPDRCGQASTPKSSNANYSFNFPGQSGVAITLNVRSPISVYGYLGKLLRLTNEGMKGAIQYYSPESAEFKKQNSFFTVIKDKNISKCFVDVEYGDSKYCVPTGDYSTAALLGIVQDLRNLSITPADILTSFTVRLTN
jgi:hypothetical protein